MSAYNTHICYSRNRQRSVGVLVERADEKYLVSELGPGSQQRGESAGGDQIVGAPQISDDGLPYGAVDAVVLDHLNVGAWAGFLDAEEHGAPKTDVVELQSAQQAARLWPDLNSKLGFVEIEIGVLAAQCLDRRIECIAQLTAETAAWEQQRNATGARIKWMFTTEKARAKMGRAYPQPQANSDRTQRVKSSVQRY